MMTIRSMTLADLSLGMRLKDEAHWNQLAEDWRRFLAMAPDGCFVAEVDGVGVGTLTTCRFGTVAWIAMLLVDARMRGQGLGTALMSHALAYLDACGVATIRLDATPQGQPVYEKLGFVAEYPLVRYAGVLPAHAPGADAQLYRAELAPALIQLDTQICGYDRRVLLTRLLAENLETTWVYQCAGQLLGYGAVRPGANATFLGPCLATTTQAGTALLARLISRYAGHPVLIDIPQQNTVARAMVTASDLREHRSFLRMYRGTLPVDQPANIWATSGAEKG